MPMKCMAQMPIPIATAPLASQYHLAFLRSACERCAVAYRDAVTHAAESSATYAAVIATTIESRISQGWCACAPTLTGL